MKMLSRYDRWQGRDLSARRYVCIWADGVDLQARLEPDVECILVIIGATPGGRKELPGFHVDVPERAEPPLGVCGQTPAGQRDRNYLLISGHVDGPSPPGVAVGDGALGLWKAVDAIFQGPLSSAAGSTRSRMF